MLSSITPTDELPKNGKKMKHDFRLVSTLSVEARTRRDIDALRYEQAEREDLAKFEHHQIVEDADEMGERIELTQANNLLHNPQDYPRMSIPSLYSAGWHIIDVQEKIINDMLDEPALVLAFQKVYAEVANRQKPVTTVLPRGPEREHFCKTIMIKGKERNRQDHDKVRLGCAEIAQECEEFVLDTLTAPTVESLRKPKRALATKISTLFLKEIEWNYFQQLTASVKAKKSTELTSIVKASPMGKHIEIDSKKMCKIAKSMADGFKDIKKTREELYKGNLGIVSWYVQRKLGLDSRDPDTIQNGADGLLHATGVWHPSNGSFGSAAAPWIRQHILQDNAKHSRTIRLPIQAHELLLTIDRLKTSHVIQTGEDLSTDELVKLTGSTKETVEHLLPHLWRTASLDKHVGSDDDSSTLLDLYQDKTAESPEELYTQKSFKADVNDFLNGLKGQDLDVIKRRYGFGCEPETLEEIGQSYNISRERIRQIEVRAMTLLKKRARFNKTIAAYNPNNYSPT